MRKHSKPTLKYYAIMADNYSRFAHEALSVGNKSRYTECAKREIKYRKLAQQFIFEGDNHEQLVG